MVQPGESLSHRVLEAFISEHRPLWSSHTVECYNSILAAFYQQFPVTPGEPDEVVRWLRALESLRQESPLKAGTRQDYYERIRYLYRWARDNVAGAQDLPELSYESFAPRSKLRKSREE